MDNFLRNFTIVFLSTLALLIVLVDLGLGNGIFSLLALIPGRSYTAHFVLVGTIAFLVSAALHRRQGTGEFDTLSVGFIAAQVATVDEFSQAWLATRSFELADLFCNYAGIAVFMAAFHYWKVNPLFSRWLPRGGKHAQVFSPPHQ